MIEEFVPAWSLAPIVQALQTLRGVDLIVAVTFATEVGDVQRFESQIAAIEECLRRDAGWNLEAALASCDRRRAYSIPGTAARQS